MQKNMENRVNIKMVSISLMFMLLINTHGNDVDGSLISQPSQHENEETTKNLLICIEKVQAKIQEFEHAAISYTQQEDFNPEYMVQIVTSYKEEMDRIIIEFDLNSKEDIILLGLYPWKFSHFPYYRFWTPEYWKVDQWDMYFDVDIRKKKIQRVRDVFTSKLHDLQIVYLERISRPATENEIWTAKHVRDYLRKGQRPLRQ